MTKTRSIEEIDEELTQLRIARVLWDLNSWYLENDYNNETWVEAKKYLNQKYNLTLL